MISLPPEVLAVGTLGGLGYGLSAVAQVLTFRQSRVLNLAHGQVGAFGAVVFVVLVQSHGWPYLVALPVALGVGAAGGGLLELAVVRRTRTAPPLVAVVATLIAAQLLLWLGVSVGNGLDAARAFPQPPLAPSFMLGRLLVTHADVALLVLAPAFVVACLLTLRRTALGRSITAAAANPTAARLLGIRADALSAGVWGAAGALAVLSALLVIPSGGFPTAPTTGPGLLLRSLAAAGLAGFDSLAGALLAGVAIGIIEQAVAWNGGSAGLMAPILLGLLAVSVLIRRAPVGRLAAPDSWVMVALSGRAPSPRRVAAGLVAGVGAVLVTAIAVVPALSPGDVITLTAVAATGMCAVSVWIVAGLSGRLSLGQLAIAGGGAAVAAKLSASSGSAALGFLAAAIAGATLSTITVLPVLRDRGPRFAAITLAVGLAAGQVLGAPWALGSGRVPAQLLRGADGAADLALVGVVGATLAASALSRALLGRRMIAARDNAGAARNYGLTPPVLAVQAIAIAGALAGLAGAVLAEPLFSVSPGAFPAQGGVDVVVAAVLGGLASPAGALAGTALVVGIPAFVSLGAGGEAALNAGFLTVVLADPGGLIGLARRIRAPRRTATAPSRPDAAPTKASQEGPAAAAGPGGASLRLEDIRVSYGFGDALAGIDLELAAGEVVAVLGDNGAGKTTLIDVICGAVRPSAGRVWIDGTEMASYSAEERAQQGVIRSDPLGVLFPTLTTGDLARLAGQTGSRAAAHQLLASVGLGAVYDRPLAELSTGMRRIAELACALARRPRLLLLDEPTAGLAQAEIPALARIIAAARARESFTLIVVTHNRGFAALISERALRLERGAITADAALDAPVAPCTVDSPARLATVGPDRPVLSWRRAGAGYGQTIALCDLTASVAPGNVLALVGTNGAGKSTALHLAAGIVPCRGGSVALDGVTIDGWSTHRRARAGIVLAAGPASTFATLDVVTSLALARRSALYDERMQTGVWDELAGFPELTGRGRTPVAALSTGERQLLALAQALLRRPKVLLIDEPLIGLSASARQRVMAVLHRVRQLGVAIVFADGSVDLAVELADHACFLDAGHVRFHGDPVALSHRAELLVPVYLGEPT